MPLGPAVSLAVPFLNYLLVLDQLEVLSFYSTAVCTEPPADFAADACRRAGEPAVLLRVHQRFVNIVRACLEIDRLFYRFHFNHFFGFLASSHMPIMLPSVSRTYATKPMPATSIFGITTFPPAFTAFFWYWSTEDTLTAMDIVFSIGLRLVMPPFIAPGSFGIIFLSTGTVQAP